MQYLIDQLVLAVPLCPRHVNDPLRPVFLCNFRQNLLELTELVLEVGVQLGALHLSDGDPGILSLDQGVDSHADKLGIETVEYDFELGVGVEDRRQVLSHTLHSIDVGQKRLRGEGMLGRDKVWG